MIEIKNVSFAYQRGVQVLDGFSLTFPGGGVYGLLGKNGTGKSTLLYLMTGLLRPQVGRVTYNGIDMGARDPRALRDFFIVPEEYELPHVRLSAYARALRPFYPNFSDGLLARCLENFEMAGDMDLGRLSMGQRKKVYVCLALAANTRVLLLDEPTNGLDILSKSQFRKAVIMGMDEGKTVIVSTHQVHDVENLLDHVVIIDRNRVLLDMAYDEEERPGDLERLFIDTLTRKPDCRR